MQSDSICTSFAGESLVNSLLSPWPILTESEMRFLTLMLPRATSHNTAAQERCKNFIYFPFTLSTCIISEICQHQVIATSRSREKSETDVYRFNKICMTFSYRQIPFIVMKLLQIIYRNLSITVNHLQIPLTTKHYYKQYRYLSLHPSLQMLLRWYRQMLLTISKFNIMDKFQKYLFTLHKLV